MSDTHECYGRFREIVSLVLSKIQVQKAMLCALTLVCVGGLSTTSLQAKARLHALAAFLSHVHHYRYAGSNGLPLGAHEMPQLMRLEGSEFCWKAPPAIEWMMRGRVYRSTDPCMLTA